MIKSPSLPKRLSSLPNSPYHMVSSLWQVNRIFFYRLKNHWISGVISQLMQRPFVEKVKQNKAIETKGDKLLKLLRDTCTVKLLEGNIQRAETH